MIKLALIKVARLIGPQQKYTNTIAEEVIINNKPHTLIYGHAFLKPHAWQTKLAHWVLGDVRESRIDWQNIPAFNTAHFTACGTPLPNRASQSYAQQLEELMTDIDRSTRDWGVRRDANWRFGYNKKYYQQLAVEIKKLLCLKDPRPENERSTLFRGKLYGQYGVIP